MEAVKLDVDVVDMLGLKLDVDCNVMLATVEDRPIESISLAVDTVDDVRLASVDTLTSGMLTVDFAVIEDSVLVAVVSEGLKDVGLALTVAVVVIKELNLLVDAWLTLTLVEDVDAISLTVCSVVGDLTEDTVEVLGA